MFASLLCHQIYKQKCISLLILELCIKILSVLADHNIPILLMNIPLGSERLQFSRGYDNFHYVRNSRTNVLDYIHIKYYNLISMLHLMN